jgi:predicted TIM-barrel fold metal-dependent hydrolase
MLEFMFETTRSVTNLLLSGMTMRYPRMRVIVPHGGAALPVLASRIELIAGTLSPTAVVAPHLREELLELYYDLAGAPVPEQLAALLAVADPDRLLYGSDWPWTPLAICRDLARRLDETDLLTPGLRERIMSTNAWPLSAGPGTAQKPLNI